MRTGSNPVLTTKVKRMIKFIKQLFCRHENHTGIFYGMTQFGCPKCGKMSKIKQSGGGMVDASQILGAVTGFTGGEAPFKVVRFHI